MFFKINETPMVNFPLAIAFVIFSTNSIIAMEVVSETILVQKITGVKKIHQPFIEDSFQQSWEIMAKLK